MAAAKPNGHITAGVHSTREQQAAPGNFSSFFNFFFLSLFVATNYHPCFGFRFELHVCTGTHLPVCFAC